MEHIFHLKSRKGSVQWQQFFSTQANVTQLLDWWTSSNNSHTARKYINQWIQGHVAVRSLRCHCFSERTPVGLRQTEGMQNRYFSALQLQYFSEDFPMLFRPFLVRPFSPTDFSSGLPMD
ncbi:uncharacterized protein LACBIDRAFT_298553 [Laccaria bicolor S238N-H82]|uniref:Predicted protein n=1 Tax=Laccaria bicolor (strain S238N-H82 / ATCC MYA-4686) TaxID=486041 RepID=B0DD34_LACBS|nr:uncharacterized protein LACBIDRAFT_298553 [Laccaria bicolor S238N-H82]EDR07401.1 predicted protein [Laccaria bicolor S238N-H82]|eukprot:XP_001881793.1 predicted protein [Laccaria bicolor S238N-H82]